MILQQNLFQTGRKREINRFDEKPAGIRPKKDKLESRSRPLKLIFKIYAEELGLGNGNMNMYQDGPSF